MQMYSWVDFLHNNCLTWYDNRVSNWTLKNHKSNKRYGLGFYLHELLMCRPKWHGATSSGKRFKCKHASTRSSMIFGNTKWTQIVSLLNYNKKLNIYNSYLGSKLLWRPTCRKLGRKESGYIIGCGSSTQSCPKTTDGCTLQVTPQYEGVKSAKRWG